VPLSFCSFLHEVQETTTGKGIVTILLQWVQWARHSAAPIPSTSNKANNIWTWSAENSWSDLNFNFIYICVRLFFTTTLAYSKPVVWIKRLCCLWACHGTNLYNKWKVLRHYAHNMGVHYDVFSNIAIDCLKLFNRIYSFFLYLGNFTWPGKGPPTHPRLHSPILPLNMCACACACVCACADSIESGSTWHQSGEHSFSVRDQTAYACLCLICHTHKWVKSPV